MAAQVAGVFEENLRNRILDSRILIVGAGGIGCELLKNLVLCGFPDIRIIDLDTIDVSNLNRQFLFHKEHVGKSKAEIARQSALKFNPNVNIKAYHDSITTTKYGVNFFQKFNLVLNALDNRQARNHVNRMCLTANVPLIESGTSGYNGQVEFIKKGVTQCYECTPKAKQKTYPNCTIRNTPSEPIHCIVWAKHLFNQLFGEIVEDEDVSPDISDPENVGHAMQMALKNKANDKGNIDRINTRLWANHVKYDPGKLFNKFFYDDIRYLLTMSNLWKKRTPPQPLKWEDCIEIDDKKEDDSNSVANLSDQKIWALIECVKAFSNSVKSLKHEMSKLPENDHLVWDKDDKNAMDFVTACANLRAQIFKIPQKTRFDVKQMAGNIIPAIATTNAITAGIVVMHAFKILQDKTNECKSVYMRMRPNARNQIIIPDKCLIPPNPNCYVCSKHEVILKIDTKQMTIKDFRDNVLIKELNMISPDVMMPSKNSIVISSEEGETDMNDDKLLSEMDIIDGVILDVDDYLQQYNLKIIVVHIDAERDEQLFEIITNNMELLKPEKSSNTEKNNENDKKTEIEKVASNVTSVSINEKEENDNEEPAEKQRKIDVPAATTTENIDNDQNMGGDDDDDVCFVEDQKDISTGIKRKNDPGEGPSTSKRAKLTNDQNEENDDDDDCIVLDDDE